MDHLIAKTITVVIGVAVCWLMFLIWRTAALDAVNEYWRLKELHYVVRGRPRFMMGYPAYLIVVVDDGGELYECKYELRPAVFAKARLNNYHWGQVALRYKVRLEAP